MKKGEKKSMWKKLLAACLSICMLVCMAAPLTAEAAQWKQDGKGWWYRLDNGSYPANQWKQINGKWYYFKANGYMATGWLWNGANWYYMGSDGAMRTGWQNIGGTYYYMYADGRMAVNTYIGEYYVNESGAWVSEAGLGTWVEQGGSWWYRHADGSYTSNDWEKINGSWYYFDAAGWMAVNRWIGDYYVGGDGAMLTDQWVDGVYYVDAQGKWDPTATNVDSAYTINLGNGQTATVVGHFDTAYAAQVVTLLNQYRQENGLSALNTSDFMTNASNIRSYEISYAFSHTRPDNTSCFTALDGGGYWGTGENIAYGYASPAAVMEGWKNSPGHNANMLNVNFKNVGIGVFAKKNTSSYGWTPSYTYYWVQMFSY